MNTIRRIGWLWSTGEFLSIWHLLFDGTRLCNCFHSKLYRGLITADEYRRLWEYVHPSRREGKQ